MFKKSVITCLLLVAISAFPTFPRPRGRGRPRRQKPKGPINGIHAVGYQYDSGAAWSIICKNTPHGTVPGKRDGRGGTYYPWGWKEHPCKDWELVSGMLIHESQPLPADCEARGFQSDDNSPYYNSVVVSNHGMVPGKAKLSGNKKSAWYSWGGKEHPVSANFYIVC